MSLKVHTFSWEDKCCTYVLITTADGGEERAFKRFLAFSNGGDGGVRGRKPAINLYLQNRSNVNIKRSNVNIKPFARYCFTFERFYNIIKKYIKCILYLYSYKLL